MAGNEMDAHATLNDLKYPRTDWGLRSGAFVATILCTFSILAILANPNTLIASPVGWVACITLSSSIGASYGYGIQRWAARRDENEAAEIREIRMIEAERQLREFKEAKEK
ncbi:component of SufBCD complex [Pseudophaeobacter sp. TrK17]|uniref:component of SufBCD complex n=1 Tax=Pseudophaeobacter sp. TrK17 TaxID=2815167 RepID=UPI0035CF1761